jgi:hypothetical protein
MAPPLHGGEGMTTIGGFPSVGRDPLNGPRFLSLSLSITHTHTYARTSTTH